MAGPSQALLGYEVEFQSLRWLLLQVEGMSPAVSFLQSPSRTCAFLVQWLDLGSRVSGALVQAGILAESSFAF